MGADGEGEGRPAGADLGASGLWRSPPRVDVEQRAAAAVEVHRRREVHRRLVLRSSSSMPSPHSTSSSSSLLLVGREEAASRRPPARGEASAAGPPPHPSPVPPPASKIGRGRPDLERSEPSRRLCCAPLLRPWPRCGSARTGPQPERVEHCRRRRS
jgi:hypothetical protein